MILKTNVPVNFPAVCAKEPLLSGLLFLSLIHICCLLQASIRSYYRQIIPLNPCLPHVLLPETGCRLATIYAYICCILNCLLYTSSHLLLLQKIHVLLRSRNTLSLPLITFFLSYHGRYQLFCEMCIRDRCKRGLCT